MKNFLGEFEEVVLLSVLALTATPNNYGVKIGQLIGLVMGKKISTGAIYTTLKRLEQKGLVDSVLGEPEAKRGGRAKRWFSITPSGVGRLTRTEKIRQQFNEENLWMKVN